ncbi:MAG: DUF5340 domain-containing protein [Hydrococcus sp. C42_A2020_068]|uniref:DUF5340 domain-containing protein n=1 Tax=Pleurocapsa sp. PCC 7327 TaxID=118163 RepID=UPI00029FA7B5|nr:DUF5340 domain-containing protein [Pleurocapsa sp. PCC 7327]AFY78839.1 hypothetical protein Ple7327_3645 [Pleurocapsa sp. PCC 7327]MBF2020610.1 DUF5340 domain-containing protein [Hydrococcus sp. C42_A2020_068]
MEPLPLPSHIHYELLLQLLERQTLFAANQNPVLRDQVQQLIATLRKAFAQQKQLEATCQQTYVSFEHRWSLNSGRPEKAPDFLATQTKPNEES